jgi:hypothetical protein
MARNKDLALINEVAARAAILNDLEQHKLFSKEIAFNELHDAWKMARKQERPEVMGRLTMNKAELCGVLVHRHEVGAPGDFTMARSVAEIVEAVGLQLGPEAATLLTHALEQLDKAETLEHTAAPAASDP